LGFPLRLGTYWIYQGTWEGPARSETLTWKTEVVRSVQSGRYEIAVLKNWYSPRASRDQPPRDRIIVRNGGKYYQLDGSNPDADLRVWLADLRELESQLNGANDTPLLELPPPEGCLGHDPTIKPGDSFCWTVEKGKPVRFEKVEGISPDKLWDV